MGKGTHKKREWEKEGEEEKNKVVLCGRRGRGVRNFPYKVRFARASRSKNGLLLLCLPLPVCNAVQVIPSPTNVGITRATPTASPLVVISDGVKSYVALRVLSSTILALALALGRPTTKLHTSDAGWDVTKVYVK